MSPLINFIFGLQIFKNWIDVLAHVTPACKWRGTAYRYVCYRKMIHSMLTVVCDQSWMDGFDPGDIHGCVVTACVLENNTVAVLKFLPEQQWSVLHLQFINIVTGYFVHEEIMGHAMISNPPNLRCLTSPVMEICKTLQNVENVVI